MTVSLCEPLLQKENTACSDSYVTEFGIAMLPYLVINFSLPYFSVSQQNLRVSSQHSTNLTVTLYKQIAINKTMVDLWLES